MSAWGSCTKNSPDTWSGLAYKVKLGQLGPLQEARDVPAAILLHCFTYLISISWAFGAEPVKQLREDTSAGWSGLRRWCSCSRGRDRGGTRAPPLNAQVSTRHPPLAPNDPILPMSSPTTPWKVSTCNPDPMNLGVACGEMMPQHWLRKNWGNKSGLCGQGVGQWSHITPRPDPFPSRRHSQRVRWHF